MREQLTHESRSRPRPPSHTPHLISLSVLVMASAAATTGTTASAAATPPKRARNGSHDYAHPAFILAGGTEDDARETLSPPASDAGAGAGTGSGTGVTSSGTAAAESERPHRGGKVSIIGVGQVGMAAAFAMLNQGIASEIALVDIDAGKVEAECSDLRHGSAFNPAVRVRGGTDYACSAKSDLVVLTAGVRQRVGESRLELVGRNVEIFKGIIPQIVAASPDAAICVVSNPCDVMTAVTAHLARLPPGRVFGSGTALDSSRFREIIGRKLGVGTASVHGYIVGEHGDSSVPLWSSVTVGGANIHPDALGLDEVHKDVVGAAYKVIAAKGYTNWAVGLTVASLARSVLRDERRVLPVSTCVAGQHGIPADMKVFLSVPAVIGHAGAIATIAADITDDERAQFRKSADHVYEVQSKIVY